MLSIADLGRLLFFADLRPDHGDVIVIDGQESREVACVIVEQSAVELIKRRVLFSWWLKGPGKDSMSDERLDQATRGKGVETFHYLVLHLDASGGVIDDSWFDDLEEAKQYLDDCPGVAWEPLPSDPREAAEAIRQRLA